MLKEKKTLILVITMVLLYFILVSPNVLSKVVLPHDDALIITLFVGFVTLILSFYSKQETTMLKRKLIRQHSQLTAIINNSPFVVFLKSPEGNIILANEVLADLFSTKRELLVGKNSYEFVVNPKICIEEDKHLLATKEIITCERYEELVNGEGHWFRIVRVPVLDENDEISSIVVIFRIIDDVKELEERKNTFIATLTHDLKTPTIAQIRALDLLLSETFGKIGDEQKEMLEQIKSSCKYMYDLIFTILDTYLYDNGLTKINPEKFDILDLINETTRGLSNLIAERGQKEVVSAELDSSNIYADKVQIKRVIINLLTNAVTYGFKNSDIEVFITDEDKNLKVEVRNKSEYINEEQMQEIFEKYKHVKNSKSIKTSTGLGLYLSKQIVDAHNGKIFAHSNAEKSCSFGFVIPKESVKVCVK